MRASAGGSPGLLGSSATCVAVMRGTNTSGGRNASEDESSSETASPSPNSGSLIRDMPSPSSAAALRSPISVAANTASILSCEAAMKNAAKYPKSKPASLGAMPSHQRS